MLVDLSARKKVSEFKFSLKESRRKKLKLLYKIRNQFCRNQGGVRKCGLGESFEAKMCRLVKVGTIQPKASFNRDTKYQ